MRYTSIFQELLSYFPFLKEEKNEIHIFISGLPIEFKDRIDFDEPR